MQSPDVVTDLLIELRSAAIKVAEISVQKPSLDEVFLALTGHAATEDEVPDDASELIDGNVSNISTEKEGAR